MLKQVAMFFCMMMVSITSFSDNGKHEISKEEVVQARPIPKHIC